MKQHTVADIRFTPGDDAGSPLTCRCGWGGFVAEWSDHRGPLEPNRHKSVLGPAQSGERLRRYPVPV